MKKHKSNYKTILTLILIFFFCNSCENPLIDERIPDSPSTTKPFNICATTATSGGHVDQISSYQGRHDYKDPLITSKGVCWSTYPHPTIANNKTTDGSGYGIIISYLTGLSPNTNYYLRAYVSNNAGTNYGEEVSFKTYNFTGTETDIDGNIYNFITIGTQQWLVENLKTTKYTDGTTIPLVTDNSIWYNLSTPGYCWYDNNEATNKNKYGALYNYYAVKTKKLAPAGWHVPTIDEFKKLENYISNNPGTSLTIAKALAATSDWVTSANAGDIGNNLTINNSSGFTALPSGWRHLSFENIGVYGTWWTSSYIDNMRWTSLLFYNNSGLHNWSMNSNTGLSVRCIRN